LTITSTIAIITRLKLQALLFIPVTWLDKLQDTISERFFSMDTATDKRAYSEDFLRWAKILSIPGSRWDEPLMRNGLPLLARAEQLQVDLGKALDYFKDGVDLSREELILSCVCAMLQDKITGKNEFGEYIRGKMAACGFEVKEAKR